MKDNGRGVLKAHDQLTGTQRGIIRICRILKECLRHSTPRHSTLIRASLLYAVRVFSSAYVPADSRRLNFPRLHQLHKTLVYIFACDLKRRPFPSRVDTPLFASQQAILAVLRALHARLCYRRVQLIAS